MVAKVAFEVFGSLWDLDSRAAQAASAPSLSEELLRSLQAQGDERLRVSGRSDSEESLGQMWTFATISLCSIEK